MRATCNKRDLFYVFVLSYFVILLCSTFTAVVAGRKMVPHLHSSGRRSRSQSQSNGKQSLHHRPLTEEQKTDQNLQFMLSLYRSAAEPDGRPKQHRRFGSNTVRLLRPSASSIRTLSALRDHHYIFTVEYDLSLPMEQLVRASFVHLRSSSVSSSTSRAHSSPRCRARVTPLGGESRSRPFPGGMVTLEPQDQWSEIDITAHVSGHVVQERPGRLTLTAQYWCLDSGYPGETRGPTWRLVRGRNRSFIRGASREGYKKGLSAYHFEVPSLLLYLEEDKEMRGLFGPEPIHEGKVRGPSQPAVRQRRSKEAKTTNSSRSNTNEASQNPLKDPPSSSSASFSPSIILDIPNYKRRTSVPKNRCKLHSFRLSFDELGWGHYFIAPPVYNPRFCQGDCPRVLHYGYHSPNHAIIQTVINEMGVGEVPALSCVPYKYMPMSVLVVHKNKVEYKELEDMVAESCTCR